MMQLSFAACVSYYYSWLGNNIILTHSRTYSVDVKDEHEQTQNDAEAGAKDEASIGVVATLLPRWRSGARAIIRVACCKK